MECILEAVFEMRLTSIGKVIVLLDTWEEPLYLTRVWCLFEQYSAAKLHIPVETILPRKAKHSLLAAMKEANGMKKVEEALSKVDCIYIVKEVLMNSERRNKFTSFKLQSLNDLLNSFKMLY